MVTSLELIVYDFVSIYLQAYELKEFQPTYSRNGHSDLSESGLQQMRLVLARSLLGTQLQLVPLCHPPAEGMSRLVCYTVDDFKQNVELRASYLPYQQVIVCPVKPSPSAAKISSTFRKLVSVKDTKQNSSKADSIEIDVPKEENHETSMNSTVSTSTNDPQTLKSGQSPDVAKASSADIRTPTCLRSSTPMVRGEDVIKGKEDVQEKKNEDGSISTPTRKGHSGRKRSDQVNSVSSSLLVSVLSACVWSRSASLHSNLLWQTRDLSA